VLISDEGGKPLVQGEKLDLTVLSIIDKKNALAINFK